MGLNLKDLKMPSLGDKLQAKTESKVKKVVKKFSKSKK